MSSPSFSLVLVLSLVGCSAPIERTVVYDERHGDSTSMDLYLPDDSRPHGALVFFHGGAWKWFHKEGFRSSARRLARAGYVAASVEYRLTPEGRFPNAVRDAACALAYLQNHANELGIDPKRIALMGYSAGAQLAGLLAVAPDHPGFTSDCAEGVPEAPAAMISIAGPMDMFSLVGASELVDYLGGSSSSIPAIYSLASPISHVTADDPPFLLIHGSRDLIFPVENSRDMQAALEGVGVETTFLEMRGTGHIGNMAEEPGEFSVLTPYDSTEAWIVIMDFLERHIGAP